MDIPEIDSLEIAITLFTELKEKRNENAWTEADFLSKVERKFGSGSLVKMANSFKIPYATLWGYVKVSRAFPEVKRNPMVSFTHHMKAMQADDYDRNTQQFTGEKRFEWVNKVADNEISTRKLVSMIGDEKNKAKGIVLTCVRCGKENAKSYSLVRSEDRRQVAKFNLDGECFHLIFDSFKAK